MGTIRSAPIRSLHGFCVGRTASQGQEQPAARTRGKRSRVAGYGTTDGEDEPGPQQHRFPPPPPPGWEQGTGVPADPFGFVAPPPMPPTPADVPVSGPPPYDPNATVVDFIPYASPLPGRPGNWPQSAPFG